MSTTNSIDSLPPMPDSPGPDSAQSGSQAEQELQPLTGSSAGTDTPPSQPPSAAATAATPPGSPPPGPVGFYRQAFEQDGREFDPKTTTFWLGPGRPAAPPPAGTATTAGTKRPAQDPLPPPQPGEKQVPASATIGASRAPRGPIGPIAIEPQSAAYKQATLRFCTVCASNNNRSMEAHRRLSVYYPTISFGTGSLVRLPGPSVTEPNVYRFGVTTYRDIHDELERKDPWLYNANGLLPMLARNKALKWGPERWQDWPVGQPRTAPRFAHDRGAEGTENGTVDVVITCEARCWDAVIDDLHSRGAPLNRPVHVINIDIKDNHEEALVGGAAILDLAHRLDRAAKEEMAAAGEPEWASAGAARDTFDERVPAELASWQDQYPNLPAMWSLSWF